MLYPLTALLGFVGMGALLDRLGEVDAPWAPAACLAMGLLGLLAGTWV